MNVTFADELLERRWDSTATAVVDLETGEQVSYRTLARRVQALTELLSGLGVGRGGTVAMVMDKSAASVAVMWAALRLGARYVPLDESLPAARIATLLTRCAPTATLVQPGHRGLLDGAPAGKVVTVGADPVDAGTGWDPSAEAEPRPAESAGRSPEDDAYVVFTSGSTGSPKGVVISHRSMCALLTGVQETVRFEEGMRFLNVTPLFFDASVVDLWSTFLVGGTVHLLPRLRMPTQVTRAIEEWRITDTLLVPSVIRMLVSRFSDAARRDLGSLRRLWFGGESCPVPVLQAFSALVPGLRYVHGYGPTETTHSATLFLTDAPGADGDEFLPIGHPLPAVDVLVVDDALRPVPEGETGELLIGGAQVMTGYCDEPERTAHAVVELPAGSGRRYYRSGDYVRQRPGDGALVFLGRRDDALKINGNLVHLSEVEAATLAVAEVTDCCALPVAHPLTGRAIMLFVLGARGGDTGPREEALRRELALRLPEYMLPARIEFLADGHVSLTPSGKLDRARLREMADAAGSGTESR
ncbi:amino acid adenylation domain-containing protein [Streptomyces sp. KhCrAH-43]|uniref:amino acid adenylation domain-containing protein n=1 Tax=unclassified Streptomyces TaxID=2593676 RepID=UPI00036725CE|nr:MULTISPECIES: amino acid adenylation domain-containing protein [unclassified Streptomyces]MYS39098.1 amino acid adenylation domain-containing protein [Streptomyces sp. SID4920]MYX70582.1 amino acid adenylation domain-containing protein [Streptomyces sp. SID8373]RAJ50021.1 amino acid adenylation domain-containing protein [Streptomyces sp. KhCrAH-43]